MFLSQNYSCKNFPLQGHGEYQYPQKAWMKLVMPVVVYHTLIQKSTLLRGGLVGMCLAFWDTSEQQRYLERHSFIHSFLCPLVSQARGQTPQKPVLPSLLINGVGQRKRTKRWICRARRKARAK